MVTECPKSKTNGEKFSQSKSGLCTVKTNGEGSTLKDKIGTKEPVVNGTENISETIVNGEPKKELDCDISSSHNANVVSNGVNSDSDDPKSNKSEDKSEVPPSYPNKTAERKQSIEKKKDKKTKMTDKRNDSDKKNESAKEKNTEEKKNEGNVNNVDSTDKVKSDNNTVVNGDGDRESSPSEDGDEKKRDAEVVFIQDMGFTVKIVSPGAEPLDIQVKSEFLITTYFTNIMKINLQNSGHDSSNCNGEIRTAIRLFVNIY